MTAINILICIAIIFTALCVACAVAFAMRGANAGIGRWRDAPADPFASPFGDLPGFNEQQLRAMAREAMRNIARDPLRRSFPVIPEPAGTALRPPGGRRQPSGPLGAGAVRSIFVGRSDA